MVQIHSPRPFQICPDPAVRLSHGYRVYPVEKLAFDRVRLFQTVDASGRSFLD